MKTVLALGGGGMKGLVTARLLTAIGGVQSDLVVGTSTGGILAIAIALGKPIANLPDMYAKYGGTIFRRRVPSIANLIRAKYSNNGLRLVLGREFSTTTTMGDCRIPCMVVCQWKANNTLSLIKSWRDGSMSTVDAATCTSAAPTYFPSHLGRIDGGVARNNPATVALVEALEMFPNEPFRLLSIGCSRGVSGSDPTSGDWGVVPWVKHGLIESFMDAGMDASAHEARVIMGALGYPYLHVEPAPDAMGKIAMDDASGQNINRLEDMARRLIESRGDEIRGFLK